MPDHDVPRIVRFNPVEQVRAKERQWQHDYQHIGYLLGSPQLSNRHCRGDEPDHLQSPKDRSQSPARKHVVLVHGRTVQEPVQLR
jgi:hypothetical protein